MRLILLLSLLSACLIQARGQNTAPAAPQAVAASTVQDPIQGGWAVPAQDLDSRLNTDRLDAGMTVQGRWNELRLKRNELMSARHGALQEADRTLLRERATDLARLAPGSFEAHMAGYYAEFPEASAFDALRKAYAASPDRVELAGPMLGAALRAGDNKELERWARQLQAPGMVAKPLLDLAADLLASVDRNGILFTNGDMDTYPTLVRIHGDRLRPDVLVIDQRSLNDAEYRARCWEQARAKGPVPPAGPAFASQLAERTERPVYLAASIDRSWLDALAPQLHCTGLAFRTGPPPPDHMRTLEQRWKTFHKTPDAGPLSRNYLVAGSILLAHYRAVEDEARTAAIEHELRQLATRTGSLDRLYKAGVLAH